MQVEVMTSAAATPKAQARVGAANRNLAEVFRARQGVRPLALGTDSRSSYSSAGFDTTRRAAEAQTHSPQ